MGLSLCCNKVRQLVNSILGSAGEIIVCSLSHIEACCNVLAGHLLPSAYPVTQCNRPDDLHLLQYRCEYVKFAFFCGSPTLIAILPLRRPTNAPSKIQQNTNHRTQLGILGTVSAFAFRHRETKKNLCRGGRWQDLPNTDFQPAVRHLK